jgi:membrane protein involved in colicin uptake
MKMPKIPGWAVAVTLVVVGVGGAAAGAAYRAEILQIQADTVAYADEAIAASEDATLAVEEAREASQLADTAATSQLADEQAAAAAEAARVAEEARVAAEASAAEAARQAAVPVPVKKSTNTGGGSVDTGKMRVPMATSPDGTQYPDTTQCPSGSASTGADGVAYCD